MDGHWADVKSLLWAVILHCCICTFVNIPVLPMKKLVQQVTTQYSQGLTASMLMMLSLHPWSFPDLSVTSWLSPPFLPN